VESILGNTEKIKLYWMFWVVQGAKLFNKIFFLKSNIKYNDLSLPNHTVKKAIGDLNFRRVIPFLVMESSISWVKNLFPSPGAFLFITDVTKIYFYSTDV
jgi:hypothetical protein